VSIAAEQFKWWDPNNLMDPHTWLGAGILGVVILAAAWIAGRALRLAIHRFLDRAERAGADSTGIRFLGKLSNVFVYVLAFLVYSNLVPALDKLGTASLTSVGLLSVVFGLAAQSTLGNLIAGISLVLYRPFKIGDLLEVSGPKGVETGIVENINLGTTVLRTTDGRRLVIPNNTMSNQVCINRSSARKGVPCSVTITLVSNADVPAARKILTDVARANPKTVNVDACNVTGLSGAGTALTLDVWCADTGAAAQLKSELLEELKRQLDAANIRIV
jgi:small conductance mechanosensitive channel